MEAAIQEDVSADPHYDELNRLFQLYRLANLNARYYGIRAEKFEWRNKGALIATAALSMMALALILAADQSNALARDWAAAFAGIAAFISGVTPFFGWAEKVRDLRNLHFAYSQLFGQAEFAIAEIRRAGSVSPEHVGLARMVHEGYMRVETLDELEPDQALVDKEKEKVNKAFPDDYLWTGF
jgi:hypothetical protein